MDHATASKLRALHHKYVDHGEADAGQIFDVISRRIEAAMSGEGGASADLLRELRADRAEAGRIMNILFATRTDRPGRRQVEDDVASIVQDGDAKTGQGCRSGGELPDLSDDEAALLYHVGRFGAEGYPVEKLGSRWYWRSWQGVRGSPIAHRTKKAAVEAFEGWVSLARMRWAQMRQACPDLILTAVGIKGR